MKNDGWTVLDTEDAGIWLYEEELDFEPSPEADVLVLRRRRDGSEIRVTAEEGRLVYAMRLAEKLSREEREALLRPDA